MGCRTAGTISFDKKFVSGSDLSTKVGYIGYLNSTTIALGGDNTGRWAILDGGNASGDYVEVGFGPCWLETGGAITMGADIVCDSNGKAVASTTGKNPIGFAMMACGSGEKCLCYLMGRVDDEATA